MNAASNYFGILLLIFFILAIIGYVLSISLLCQACDAKGRSDIKGTIIFIAIVLTPVVAALCTIAFPSRNDKQSIQNSDSILPPI